MTAGTGNSRSKRPGPWSIFFIAFAVVFGINHLLMGLLLEPLQPGLYNLATHVAAGSIATACAGLAAGLVVRLERQRLLGAGWRAGLVGAVLRLLWWVVITGIMDEDIPHALIHEPFSDFMASVVLVLALGVLLVDVVPALLVVRIVTTLGTPHEQNEPTGASLGGKSPAPVSRSETISQIAPPGDTSR